jgi:endonuclease YncB( thermonuclease family)
MKFKTAAIALALCLALQVQADTLLGKVINVADGDTITVLDDTHTQHKIRRPALMRLKSGKHSAMSPSRAWPSR